MTSSHESENSEMISKEVLETVLRQVHNQAKAEQDVAWEQLCEQDGAITEAYGPDWLEEVTGFGTIAPHLKQEAICNRKPQQRLDTMVNDSKRSLLVYTHARARMDIVENVIREIEDVSGTKFNVGPVVEIDTPTKPLTIEKGSSLY